MYKDNADDSSFFAAIMSLLERDAAVIQLNSRKTQLIKNVKNIFIFCTCCQPQGTTWELAIYLSTGVRAYYLQLLYVHTVVQPAAVGVRVIILLAELDLLIQEATFDLKCTVYSK